MCRSYNQTESANTCRCLTQCILLLADGDVPYRIKCVGFCLSGMAATVAALWSALLFPSADVRCITLGAQKVGNAAFAAAFRSALQYSASVGVVQVFDL